MCALSKLKLVSDGEPVKKPLVGRSHFTPSPVLDIHGWTEAVEDFLVHKRGKCEASTVRWYRERLAVARQWMTHEGRKGEGVPLADFRARDMDQYLMHRTTDKNATTGAVIMDSTRRADAIALKAFVKWCRREGIIEHNPLADYDIPRADKPYIPTPKADKIAKLLTACQERWSISTNPAIRFMSPDSRTFYKRRNYAILTGLTATGMRIGEMLALTVADIDFERRVVVTRKTKGNNWREVPFEAAWVEPLKAWLKVRPQCDSALLFFTAYGTKIGYKEYLHSYNKDVEFAGVGRLTLHMLRHYSTDAVAKTNIKAASQRAGHANIATTQAYLHKDIEHVREAVDESSPLRAVLGAGGKGIIRNKRTEQQKRRKLV